MQIRPFEWHDLPALHSYRNDCVFLDSTRVLSRGPIYVPTGALLSMLSPATGLYTYAYQATEPERQIYFGQVSYSEGNHSARMTFLAPGYALDTTLLTPLIENLVVPVAERGAMHLVAEAEDPSSALGVLRQAGFGIYARQRIWRLRSAEGEMQPGLWRTATHRDEAAIRFLYANLVPGLVQQVETLSEGRLRGLVFYRGSELLAFVDIISGMSGVYAVPVVHPDAETIAEQLVRVLQHLPSWRSRPVYIAVRSYQSWMENLLYRLGADPGPQQAVMVKRMAVRRSLPETMIPALNGAATEPT
jgi:hypothetical protein